MNPSRALGLTISTVRHLTCLLSTVFHTLFIVYLVHWPVHLNPNGNHPNFPTRPDGTRDIVTDWPISKTWEQMEAVLKKGKHRTTCISHGFIKLTRLQAKSVRLVCLTAQRRFWSSCSPTPPSSLRSTNSRFTYTTPSMSSLSISRQGASPHKPTLPWGRRTLLCSKTRLRQPLHRSILCRRPTFCSDTLVRSFFLTSRADPDFLVISVAKGYVVLPKSVTPARIASNIKGALAAAKAFTKEDLEKLDGVAASGKQRRCVYYRSVHISPFLFRSSHPQSDHATVGYVHHFMLLRLRS